MEISPEKSTLPTETEKLKSSSESKRGLPKDKSPSEPIRIDTMNSEKLSPKQIFKPFRVPEDSDEDYEDEKEKNHQAIKVFDMPSSSNKSNKSESKSSLGSSSQKSLFPIKIENKEILDKSRDKKLEKSPSQKKSSLKTLQPPKLSQKTEIPSPRSQMKTITFETPKSQREPTRAVSEVNHPTRNRKPSDQKSKDQIQIPKFNDQIDVLRSSKTLFSSPRNNTDFLKPSPKTRFDAEDLTSPLEFAIITKQPRTKINKIPAQNDSLGELPKIPLIIPQTTRNLPRNYIPDNPEDNRSRTISPRKKAPDDGLFWQDSTIKYANKPAYSQSPDHNTMPPRPIINDKKVVELKNDFMDFSKFLKEYKNFLEPALKDAAKKTKY